jgi:hypothetical protein
MNLPRKVFARRALATTVEARQPTPLDAKSKIRALQAQQEKFTRKISGTQAASATEAGTYVNLSLRWALTWTSACA